VLAENPKPTQLGPPAYFARVVRDGLNVPVGVILVALPGTSFCTWLSKETLEAFPAQAGKQDNFYQETLALSEKALSKFTRPVTSWESFKKVETTWRETKKGPWPSGQNDFVLGHVVSDFPSSLYNTRIHPLAPFALRGALFICCLGDSGSGAAERVVAMVKQWRKLFGQDLSFIYGPNPRRTFMQPPLTPLLSGFFVTNYNLPSRQAIKLFGADKNVGFVELNDVGDGGAHFLQKNEQGRRLGLAALSVAYGQKQIYTGPRMVEIKIEPRKAIVRFEQVGDGLVYQPSIDGISGVYLRGKTGPGPVGTGEDPQQGYRRVLQFGHC